MPKEEPIHLWIQNGNTLSQKKIYLPFTTYFSLLLSCVLDIISTFILFLHVWLTLVCEITPMQQSPAFPVQPVNMNDTHVHLSKLKEEVDTSDVAPESLRSVTRTNRPQSRGAESVSWIAL